MQINIEHDANKQQTAENEKYAAPSKTKEK